MFWSLTNSFWCSVIFFPVVQFFPYNDGIRLKYFLLFHLLLFFFNINDVWLLNVRDDYDVCLCVCVCCPIMTLILFRPALSTDRIEFALHTLWHISLVFISIGIKFMKFSNRTFYRIWTLHPYIIYQVLMSEWILMNNFDWFIHSHSIYRIKWPKCHEWIV